MTPSWGRSPAASTKGTRPVCIHCSDPAATDARARGRDTCGPQQEEFMKRCFYQQGTYDQLPSFQALDATLTKLEARAFPTLRLTVDRDDPLDAAPRKTCRTGRKPTASSTCPSRRPSSCPSPRTPPTLRPASQARPSSICAAARRREPTPPAPGPAPSCRPLSSWRRAGAQAATPA